MPEVSLEELIAEQEFARLLAEECTSLRSLVAGLHASASPSWTKRQYFLLIHEANTLESFLDDHGAKYNRAFAYLRELVASIRWIALSGYSLQHLHDRLHSYRVKEWMAAPLVRSLGDSLQQALDAAGEWSIRLTTAIEEEFASLGIAAPAGAGTQVGANRAEVRRRLPRNIGQADLENEEQKIAGVAARFIEACDLFSEIGVRRFTDADELDQFFRKHCTEAKIRVFEATIHNLQSTYDTHIQNSVLESKDERLPRLRGCVSVSLHAIEAALYLTHFLERHEDEVREAGDFTSRIRALVDPALLRRIVVNDLFRLANDVLQSGLELAEALVPTYTNVQELILRLADDTTLHARPAALIVGIVNHHGTPVELEVAGKRCNASSILELLVAVGSNPDQREFTFHGDEKPLADIKLLFESRLGEDGLESLPSALEYLRTR